MKPIYYATMTWVHRILYPFRALDDNEEVWGNFVMQPETLQYLTVEMPDSSQDLVEELKRNANAADLVSSF